MRPLLLLLTLPLAAPHAPATRAATSDRALTIEITVPAPRTEVWKAFTTSAGLSTWLAPNAIVNLKPGGDWMVHFPGGSTGGGTIMSFVPEKEIVLSALAPDQFPTVRATHHRALHLRVARRGDRRAPHANRVEGRR
jgi:uncharacterized protein YndB with AHSA1/START domain